MKIYNYRITKKEVTLIGKLEKLVFNRKEHNFIVTPICVVDLFEVNTFYKYYNFFHTTLKPLSQRQKNILLRKYNEII